MPDSIEVATSGRARCRACLKTIAKGEERFAEALPNPVAEGETRHYFHLPCAAERRPKNFSELFARLDPPRPELEPLAHAAALAVQHRRLERLGVVERAKSARATCRQCREAIEKDGWRVAIQPFEDGRLAAWGYLHLRCVVNYAGVKPSSERLVRYGELTEAERAEVARLVDELGPPVAAEDGGADDRPDAARADEG